MNSIPISKIRAYLLVFLFAGFFINAASCTESAKVPKTVKSTKSMETKATSDKKKSTSNPKKKQKKSNQRAGKSNTNGNYWSELQSALNLSNPQIKCLKTAKRSYQAQEEKLPKVGGKVNNDALAKLKSKKNTKMKKCIGKELFEKSKVFNAERNKESK